MGVPYRWWPPRDLFERGDNVLVKRKVRGIELPFLVQKPLPGCIHACTIDDIVHVLQRVPPHELFGEKHVTGLDGIILRQPTRSSRRLRGAWGRLFYQVEIGPIRDVGIYLDATDVPTTLKWSRRLDPEHKAELERLLEEASAVREDKRHYHMEFDLDAIRRVQLYRTLLHEIGHMVHYQEFVERAEIKSAAAAGRSFDRARCRDLEEDYFAQARADGESFADRYAERVGAELRKLEVIPFARRVDVAGMRAEGLDPRDFGA